MRSKFSADDGIEAGRRLVEEQQFRIEREGARTDGALAHAAGNLRQAASDSASGLRPAMVSFTPAISARRCGEQMRVFAQRALRRFRARSDVENSAPS